MIFRHIRDFRREPAGDGCYLVELLHPGRHPGRLPLTVSIAHAFVPPGEATLPHRLVSSTEAYYFISGTGVMHVDKESVRVESGSAVLVPPGAIQFLKNTGSGNLEFIVVVEPAWRKEDEEIVGGASGDRADQ